jgi:hypothetical protein
MTERGLPTRNFRDRPLSTPSEVWSFFDFWSGPF